MNEETRPSPTPIDSKKIMLFAIAGAMLLSVIYLILILGHALGDGSGFELVFDIVLMGIVLALQYYYFRRVRDDWEGMTSGRRWWIGIAAIVVPPVVAFFGLVLAAVALLLWIISLFFRKGNTISFGGIFNANYSRTLSGNVYDKYGNRVGSMEADTGIMKDKYGNRVGSIDSGTGIIKDKYGNRIGSEEASTGIIKDKYGNRVGSMEADTGIMKDKYGNPIGSVD